MDNMRVRPLSHKAVNKACVKKTQRYLPRNHLKRKFLCLLLSELQCFSLKVVMSVCELCMSMTVQSREKNALLLYLLLKRQQTKKKRRFLVHNIVNLRPRKGEFVKLFQKLINSSSNHCKMHSLLITFSNKKTRV